MKVLLDTHVLLWASGEPRRLGASTRALLDDQRHELFFSAASIWEIAVKHSLGRTDFVVDVRELHGQLLDNGYIEIPVTSAHAANIDALPALHTDPFDRILLAQAVTEGLTLVTNDAQVAKYPGPIRKV